MRFAYVAALSCFAFLGTAVVIACSDDTGTTPGGGSTTSSSSTSTSSGSSSGQQPGDDDDDEDPTASDAGVTHAPDGCKLYSTELLKAGVAKSVPRGDVAGGGVAWETPEGAISEDGEFATVTLEEGQESAYLELSDYKIDLPDDKATWGVIVQLKRQSLDSGVEDVSINLVMDTEPPPTPKRFSKPWPRQIVGTHHYGARVDTWRTYLYPKNLRPTTFGPRLAARRMADVSGPVVAKVDSLKVQVWYCNADKL
ncbi:MAG: hypothetical protein KIT84_20620 [Labilithrix sp.]|nr:hypothetical protein [Labilithrix sp.]MCW5813445.1 hypothetical protein [Labilithrix sp.]